MKKLTQPLVILLLLVLAPIPISMGQRASSPAQYQQQVRLIARFQETASLPRSTPEQQGISSSDLQAFVEAADKDIDAMNSFMLVRHGHVVAEGWWGPYDRDTPHILFSLSKSFTSTAVGLAISEGKLTLDDQVLKFFPEDAPADPSVNLRAMRVRDLLRMSSGNQTEAQIRAGEPDDWRSGGAR